MIPDEKQIDCLRAFSIEIQPLRIFKEPSHC